MMGPGMKSHARHVNLSLSHTHTQLSLCMCVEMNGFVDNLLIAFSFPLQLAVPSMRIKHVAKKAKQKVCEFKRWPPVKSALTSFQSFVAARNSKAEPDFLLLKKHEPAALNVPSSSTNAVTLEQICSNQFWHAPTLSAGSLAKHLTLFYSTLLIWLTTYSALIITLTLMRENLSEGCLCRLRPFSGPLKTFKAADALLFATYLCQALPVAGLIAYVIRRKFLYRNKQGEGRWAPVIQVLVWGLRTTTAVGLLMTVVIFGATSAAIDKEVVSLDRACRRAQAEFTRQVCTQSIPKSLHRSNCARQSAVLTRCMCSFSCMCAVSWQTQNLWMTSLIWPRPRFKIVLVPQTSAV